jgi:hypothetical protein
MLGYVFYEDFTSRKTIQLCGFCMLVGFGVLGFFEVIPCLHHLGDETLYRCLRHSCPHSQDHGVLHPYLEDRSTPPAVPHPRLYHPSITMPSRHSREAFLCLYSTTNDYHSQEYSNTSALSTLLITILPPTAFP